MSLVGIDVGSSSVKVAAYSEDGELIAQGSAGLTPIRPAPGVWETDPEDIWRATSAAMQQLAANEALRRDPVRALAISASGRENLPADADGNPLGNGIMGADTRGGEFEVPPEGAPIPEPWCLSCGHLRERMDPVHLAELAASIRVSGVLQPVLLRPVGSRFQLVAGHRRTAAARQAGITTIPAIANFHEIPINSDVPITNCVESIATEIIPPLMSCAAC